MVHRSPPFVYTASTSVTVVPGDSFVVVSSSCCVRTIHTPYRVDLEVHCNSNFLIVSLRTLGNR